MGPAVERDLGSRSFGWLHGVDDLDDDAEVIAGERPLSGTRVEQEAFARDLLYMDSELRDQFAGSR